MSFLSKIFSSKNSIKNGGQGTFFGKLIRSASAAIPIVGSVVSSGLNAAAEVKMANVAAKTAAEQMAAQPPSVENITNNSTAGMPNVSSVFPNGSNATNLNEVQIYAPRSQPVNTNFDLDWKNGTISTSTNQGADNKMLLYGLLGLGAIMVLNKK